MSTHHSTITGGEPTEPPPPYESQPSKPQIHDTNLEVPYKTRSGIPPSARRSMEDEARPLPSGWVRQYDSKSSHQFFVDTNSSPPRSIWHHPYDDETYLSTLPPAERERIHGIHNKDHQSHSPADYEVESSADEREEHIGGAHKFGRKMKDKLTNSTHQEREAKRRQREQEEQRAYELHQRFRAAMARAEQTGEPQLLGKDHEGKDVYIEPPQNMGFPGRGGRGMGAYEGGGYGYNPYNQGPYSNPDARFLRPQVPYGRPYGGGYGGGYGYGGGLGMGMPLMMGAGMGLGGGMLLGGIL